MISLKTRQIVYIGMLAALSVAGSIIKIPSPVVSVAFDSAPGYFAALFLGPLAGAAVCLLGHFATAFNSGFPLGLPIHALVASGMALSAFALGTMAKKSLPLGLFLAQIINGLLLTAILIVIPGFGWPFFVAMTPSVFIATALNLGVATALSRMPSMAGITRGH